MTLDEIVFDIVRILTHNKYGEDSRILRSNIEYKVHQYRAKFIEEIHRYTNEIDPIWIQNMGTLNLTKIKLDEDQETNYGCEDLGIVKIPTVVRLPNDMGVYRVSSTDILTQVYPISENRFMEMDKNSTRAKHRYYFRVGNKLYCYPNFKFANIQLVLTNPLEGFIIDSTHQETLILGQKYIITGGIISILNNEGSAIQYTIGQTFTATDSTYTIVSGNPIVRFSGYKRPHTSKDEYPIDGTFVDLIVKNIVQEFMAEMQVPKDTINNQKDDKNE